MTLDRRALGGGLILCALAACSGKAFRSEAETAGTGGNGGNAGRGGSAGSKAAGGVPGAGGKPALMGDAGVTTNSGAPTVGGAPEGGAGSTDPELPAIPTDGLVYWFKSDAGVQEADGGVKRWQDQSGNDHHAAQLLSEQRPKLVRSALLPFPVLELDGTNDFMELPPIDLDVTTGLAFFAVAGRREQSTCSAILELSNKPEEEDISFDSTGDSYQFEILHDTVKATEGVFPVGGLRLLESFYQVEGEGGTGEMRVNGAFVGSLGMSPPVESTREKNFIGTSQYADCTPFPGVIGEVIMYERPVSAAERVTIESYLKLKWQCCD